MNDCLAILGASARAAAFSACRARLSIDAFDMFADRDLAARGRTTQVNDYPAGLIPLLRSSPAHAWMYTGALENHPRLIDELAALKPLYGNAGGVLRRVRNPRRFAQVLRTHRFPVPEIRAAHAPPPRDGRWLLKSVHSSGGSGVSVWDEFTPPPSGKRYYFQRRQAGRSCSAAWIAAGGRAVLLGVTEQLIGTPWTGALSFHYAGSLGPLRSANATTRHLQALGDLLAAEFQVIGAFGVDFILDADEETVWPVEINPRYTASMEVLERAHDQSIVAQHIAACRDQTLPRAPGDPSRTAGKAILYARHELTITAEMSQTIDRLNTAHDTPALADLPATDSRIQPHWPILTLLAEASTFNQLTPKLQAQANQLHQLLQPDLAPVRSRTRGDFGPV